LFIYYQVGIGKNITGKGENLKQSRYYKIKYVLSNGKTQLFQDKREKVMKEWDKILNLSQEQILKKLKIKDNTITLSEAILIDWVGNTITNKIF